jgi:monoamine oxidase
MAPLAAGGVAVPAEWDALLAQLEAAEQQVKVARGHRDATVWNLEQMTLRAPFDAVVASRMLEVGQVAGPGDPVMHLDGRGRQVVVQVPDHLAARLRAKQPVQLELGGASFDEMQTVAAHIAAFSMATDADRLSARDYGGLASGDDWQVEGGYGRLVADVWSGVPVRTGHPVHAIDWTAADRIVVSGPFGALSARRVVITVPPPVLAEGLIRFNPALPPDRQTAIASLRGGRFIKVGLRLDAPMTEVPEYVCDIAKLQRGEGAVLHLDRRLPLATAILAGSYAEAVSRQGAQALQAEGRDILASFLGGTAARRVLAAAAAVDWSADPLSRGAYAVVPIGSVDARATYASPLDDRLFFAGEAAGGAHAATAHGARLSGEATAKAILALQR